MGFSGASFTTHTSIQPANSKIRFFDTRMIQTLNTDSIIIKVNIPVLYIFVKIMKMS